MCYAVLDCENRYIRQRKQKDVTTTAQFSFYSNNNINKSKVVITVLPNCYSSAASADWSSLLLGGMGFGSLDRGSNRDTWAGIGQATSVYEGW